MKHCPKCDKDYPESYLVCTDGTTLMAGSAEPWTQSHQMPQSVSNSSGQTITGEKSSSTRKPPYVRLIAILALVTAFSISYPFLWDAVRQTFAGINIRPASANISSAARDSAMAALNGWTAATNARDLNSHMNYYGDSLTVYYNHKDVSKDFVRSTRAPAFTKYTTLNVQLSNIQIVIDSSGSTATVTFTKTWDFNGARHSNGSTQQRLVLSRIAGRWLITAEEDVKINYANW
jgi:ketosteroid isomerase-like protein